MVVANITDLDLADGVTHISTDWEVSTDLLFSDVIITSIGDTSNLTSITFSDILDINAQHYGRARRLLSTGYTVWGNLDIFTPIDVYDNKSSKDMPSMITSPVITTDGDADNHFPTLFNIYVNGFSSSGDSTHVATTYIITDLDNNIMWSSVYDEVNKNSILMNDIILSDDRIYLLKAIFHSSSDDSSQVSTTIINIVDSTNVNIESNTFSFDYSNDALLQLEHICDVKSTDWRIYDRTTAGLYLISEYSSVVEKPLEVLVTADTLLVNKSYIVAVRTIKTDDTVNAWVYKELSTYG